MEKIIPIAYPEEFRITALITRMNIQEMIQGFVDGVSFYAFCGGHRKKPFTKELSLKDSEGNTHNCIVKIKEVSWLDEKAEYLIEIISNCMESYELEFFKETHPGLNSLHTKFVCLFYSLVSDSSISQAEKIDLAKLYMKDWQEKQRPLLAFPEEIILEQGEKINLSFEFNMVCRISNLCPEHVLCYYMNMLSIARVKAGMQFIDRNPDANAAASPLSGGRSIFNRMEDINDSEAEKDIRKAYEQKFVVVHASLKREKSFKKRLHTYRAFYKSWYEELVNAH